MTPPLTPAALSVWGKTDRKGTSSVGWLPLWRHLADTADVAQRLWDGWLSPAVAHRISGELPGGASDARLLLTWLAGIHDIGKATPAFAIQAPIYAERMRQHDLTFKYELVKSERGCAPHATAGQVILSSWLLDEFCFENADSFAVVVGGHHGVPPTDGNLRNVDIRRYLLGDEKWAAVQIELLTWMTERCAVKERLADWSQISLSPPVQAVLTGLVIVADWIASNEEYFPYELTEAETARIESAWDHLQLPSPWQAVTTTLTTDELFANRFPLPAGATARPVQRSAASLAEAMPIPGMMVIEAAMGEGKTEAALAAAEILARRSHAGGCFIALPTRATSDAMFSRVLGWLSRLPGADIDSGDRDVMLAHGKSAFNTEFDRLRWTSLPSGIGIDQGGADIGVHKWLAGRKRTLLSSFVIGTIDQLLFASLRAKHLVLRHLGLAGKVVVIDEAHAYDVYMNSFLDTTLEWLGAYGAPVIVLSATLPARRRAELMNAYDRGRLGPIPAPNWRDRKKPVADPYAGLRTELAYPLVTVSAAQRGGVTHPAAPSGRGNHIRLIPLDDDVATLADLLRTELADGGCALVVRNTVARVQDTAEALRTTFGDSLPVTVAHSRFMAHDRAAKDNWLRAAFGPPGTAERPQRHIVVASQVAEQSLDIDFDLLITDLAPLDLVLQRIGRLHRHVRPDRPAQLREATCYITGADWTSAPPQPASGSRRVYDEYALLRSAAVLNDYLHGGRSLRLPDDIAPLTQAAYGDDPLGPQDWQDTMTQTQQRSMQKHDEKELRARGFCLGPVGSQGSSLVGWLSGGVGDAEERVARGHVRDTDGELLEVILLLRTEDGLVLPPWIEGGGRLVPTEAQPPARLAKMVAGCTLPLPRTMTTDEVVGDVIGELEQRNNFPAWKDSHWLDGELVLDIDPDGYGSVAGFELHYDKEEGLRVSKSDVSYARAA